MAKHNEAGETGSAPKPARAKRNAVPLAERRGLSRHLSSSWTALLVQAPGGPGDADRLLDFMLETGWIGGVRRDAAADLFAGRIPRPLGSWGLVIQLAGHPWCYLVGDGLHYEWAQELAAKLDCRTALFSCSGVHGTLSAWAYEGEETLFEFECGGFLAAEGRSVVYLRKDAFPAVITGTRFDPDWLRQFKRGEDAQDALARELGIYLPVLIHRSADGQADVYGRDAVAFKPVDYTRIDLIVFGDAATLEPTPAAFALAAAIDAGDAVGLRELLAQGADTRYLPGTDDSPLDKALALGQGSLYDWRYKRISREQQLEVLAVLLEAGANPDPAGDEPAAHRVLSFGDHGDERTVIRQLRLLFEHGANPNAPGTRLRSSGQTPLHVAAFYHGWPAVIKLLLAHGADPLSTNAGGKTPREAAQARLDFLTGPNAMPARGEVARIRAAVELLTAAERGEGDLSDIDELAEVSWQAWSAEQEQRRAALKAESPETWRALHGDDA